MKKRQLEQTLRVAGQMAKETEFFVIGSQALHASCQRAPTEVLISRECDIYPKNRPEAAILLHRSLGEKSTFAKKHGFYADIVTPELATLPPGWQTRLKPLRAGKVTALCLEVHDLLASKLAAGRLKDLEFVAAVLQLKLADSQVVRRRIRTMANTDRVTLRHRLSSVLRELG